MADITKGTKVLGQIYALVCSVHYKMVLGLGVLRQIYALVCSVHYKLVLVLRVLRQIYALVCSVHYKMVLVLGVPLKQVYIYSLISYYIIPLFLCLISFLLFPCA